MWRVLGKVRLSVIAMSVLALLLILYRMSSAEMPRSATIKFENRKDMGNNHIIDISELASITQSPQQKAKLKEQEARIMADIRGKIHDGDRLHRRLFLPESSNLNENSFDGDNFKRKPKLFSGYRFVHLDLKGAPPKVSYYEELFPLLHSLGATGLLIEYEDMFPYSGSILNDVPAYNAYSKADIKKILELAKENQLDVIPLIQTFGHLEFILKLEKFSSLREVLKYPQVICPSNNDTFSLITAMIDQILALHPESRYIHIGCDEVYYLGECNACSRNMVLHHWSKSDLFLTHVIRISKYIRTHHSGVTVLTWDDEFRSLSENELTESGIGHWVEPVVWKYTTDLENVLPPELWNKYSRVFTAIWIASAFKGATGPDKLLTDIGYHLENHRAWMDIVMTYSSLIKIRGLMITGWQRYDHFAILCELLPAGLPSLAVCLGYVTSNDKGMSIVPQTVLDVLHCDSPLPMVSGTGKTRCSFPGAGVIDVAERLVSLKQSMERLCSDSTYFGWFSPYNIEKKFSSPSHVEHATTDLDRLIAELAYIERDAQSRLLEIYDKHTMNEWISTNIGPLEQKLSLMVSARDQLLGQSTWPRRPLDSQQPASQHDDRTL